MRIKRISPLKAIRIKCLECCGRSCLRVKNCADSDCPLFQYRFGKNPHRKGIGGGLANFKRKKPHSTIDQIPKTGIVEANAQVTFNDFLKGGN